MAKKSKKIDAKEQNVYKAFIDSIKDGHSLVPDTYYRLEAHRTFEWYVQMLIQEMEKDGWHKLKLESFRANANTRALVDDIFYALLNLFRKQGIAAPLYDVSYAIDEASISSDQSDRLRYHLLADLKGYIDYAKRRNDLHGTYRVVPAGRRRSPRDRSELPDPSAPAWTSGNRRKSKKVQITCRVPPDIKELSLAAANRRKISYSQWLNEAIVWLLLEEGYDAALEEGFRPRQEIERQKRRPQRRRQAMPVPDKPAYAAANRADKVMSIRIDPELASVIDRMLRSDENRSWWFSNAAYNFFREEGSVLPGPRTDRPRYSVPVSLSFEDRLFFLIGIAVKDSRLTTSEWLRRVAVWYIRHEQR